MTFEFGMRLPELIEVKCNQYMMFFVLNLLLLRINFLDRTFILSVDSQDRLAKVTYHLRHDIYLNFFSFIIDF